jgi:hypothetical protein
LFPRTIRIIPKIAHTTIKMTSNKGLKIKKSETPIIIAPIQNSSLPSYAGLDALGTVMTLSLSLT